MGGIAPADREWVSATDWIVAGPFASTADQAVWAEDYLVPLTGMHHGETRAYSQIVADLEREKTNGRVRVATAKPETILDIHSLLGQARNPDEPPAVAYATLALVAQRAGRGWLLFASSDGARVWLNGQLVSQDDTRHGLHLFTRGIAVTLKAGENLVVCRVPKFGLGWGVTLRFEGDEERAVHTALRVQDTLEPLLLGNACVKTGTPLLVAPRGVPMGVHLSARVRAADDRVVEQGEVVIGTPGAFGMSLAPGCHTFELESGGDWFRERCIVGEPADAAVAAKGALEKRIQAIGPEPDVMALLLRYQYLLDAEAHPLSKRDRQWERAIVYQVGEMRDAAQRLAANEEAFAHRPGLHLRGFRSAIDDQLEFYRIYVPPTYRADSPAKLIVALPTTLSANRPFIESVFLKYHIEAERYASIADRFGAIVIWPGYRNQPTGLPCELTHLDEVLQAVGKDYSVDEKRTCLIGACSGGALALKAALHWPERFAGIALLNPEFTLGEISEAAAGQFRDCADFAEWASTRAMVPQFLELQDMPTLIVHDGSEPGHGDLQISRRFVARAARRDFPVRFDQIQQGRSQHFDAWNVILAWCAGQARMASSKVSADAEYDTRVVSVFARKVIVVTGTGGSPAEREGIARLAEAFQADWRKVHFGPCPSVIDAALTPKLEGEANLVLIGNPTTNAVWGRLAARLPVTSDREEIVLNGVKVASHDAVFHALFRHPVHAQNRILLIGAQTLADARPPPVNAVADGWYSYAVWTGDPAKAVAAGTWKN